MPFLLLDQLDHLVLKIYPKEIYAHYRVLIPDNWEVVRFGEVAYLNWYIAKDGTISQWLRQDINHGYIALIVKAKKKKVIKFTEIRQDNEIFQNEYYKNGLDEMSICQKPFSFGSVVLIYKREETEE